MYVMKRQYILLIIFCFSAHFSISQDNSWINNFEGISDNEELIVSFASLELDKDTKANYTLNDKYTNKSVYFNSEIIDNSSIKPSYINSSLVVSNTNDSGTGSLRDAINYANSHSGPDTITFSITSSVPPFIIKPSSDMPSLTDDGTVIDATTQPGYYNGAIQLDGDGTLTDGLSILGNNCEIYGFYIYHYNQAGIEIKNAENIIIGKNTKSNYFAGNTEGIFVKNSNNVSLKYNYLGTNSNNSSGIGNTNGIILENCDTISIYQNILSANTSNGLYITNSRVIDIKGNKIGVKSDGYSSLSNTNEGIYIDNGSSKVTIGGSGSNESNTIAYNGLDGIYLNGGNECTFSQNKIYCNGNTGITLVSGTNDNIITPTIIQAVDTIITGTATPNALIELFEHDNYCSSSPCQGKTFIGYTSSDGSGNWSYNSSFSIGTNITVTATDEGLNTSAFSDCQIIVSSCQYSDSLALVELYNSTSGGSWNNVWDLMTPINSWYGVTTNTNGCVNQLNLNNNNLVGTLPDLNLPNLTNLELGDNILSGNIPDFSYLTNATVVNLYQNNFNGSIPNFSNLNSVTQLMLDRNNLSDTIPNFTNLGTLQQLFLGNNNLTGAIPDFTNLSYLNIFSAPDNLLSAMPEFSSLYNLTTLYLQGNQLSGDIPHFYSTYSLQTLRLNNNQFTGTIPDFQSYNLNAIFLDENQLDSCANFTLISNLDYLNISKNKLTFEDIIPNHSNVSNTYTYNQQDTTGITQIVNLSVGDNYTIQLNVDNGISTNSYDWFKGGTLIQTTSINQLVISNAQISDAGRYDIQISNSVVSGTTIMHHPITINVTSTCREADSLALVDLYNATNGGSWTSNNWDLTQPINTWFGVHLNANGCVTCLDLDGNNDCGSGQGTSLQLIGNLPDLDLDSLESLYLQNNKLNGNIPDFSYLKKLKTLSLGINQFTGSLIDFANLPILEDLDLRANQLSGSVPNYQNLPALKSLQLSGNNLNGTLPDFTDLGQLQSLWLFNNQISGTIPNFSGLSQLYELRLNNNEIDSIPYFSNLPLLTSLQIGYNNLTFDDVMNNSTSGTYSYNNQDSVGLEKTETLISSSYTIDLGMDYFVSSNVYYWSKDNVLYDTIYGTPRFTVTETGVLYCQNRKFCFF